MFVLAYRYGVLNHPLMERTFYGNTFGESENSFDNMEVRIKGAQTINFAN